VGHLVVKVLDPFVGRIKSFVVVMYGPLVLAGELGREGIPENLVCAGNTSHANNMAPPVPVLVGASDNPSDWIKPVEGEPLRFRTSRVGKPNDVSLIPLGNLHHQRYTVYWKTMSDAEWKDRPSLKPAAVSEGDLSAGLAYKYYEGSWDKLPEFDKLTPVKTGVADNIGLSPKQRNDNYGLVFSGYLKIAKAADYRFAVKSDDGSRLWLGGQRIIDHDGTHPMTAKYGLTLSLEPGYYPIKLEYFEQIYNEGLEVLWYAGAGKGWQRIPNEMLLH